MHVMIKRSAKPRLPRFARRLLDCTSGLALTEFAVSLPVLLTLGLVGLETANFAMAHLRISNIAMMTADNAARVRESIDEADIVELFTGASLTGTGIAFGQNGRIVLTDIEIGQALPTSGPRVPWIRWQRCFGQVNVTPRYGIPRNTANLAITNGTEVFLADRTTANPLPSAVPVSTGNRATPTIQPQDGSALMIVEVVYNYQPLIPNSPLAGREIRYESAFNVRQRNDQLLHNANRVQPMSCDRYQST